MQTGMTAVTIRSRLKELRKYLDSFDFEKRKYARKKDNNSSERLRERIRNDRQ